MLVDGADYEFKVGGDQQWFDAQITTTADGYDRWWLHWARGMQRFADADLFTLIGQVGSDSSSAFAIGTNCRQRAKGNGELFCYANDVASMYWNNSGCVVLTIRRLR